MIILSIKTDQPKSQFELYKDHKPVASISYLADRDLATTIHQKLKELLSSQKLDWADIEGLICFKGPGSFTGLRIGLSVANALAYGSSLPIIGEQGQDWRSQAISRLLKGQNDQLVVPFYGSEPHVTKPRK